MRSTASHPTCWEITLPTRQTNKRNNNHVWNWTKLLWHTCTAGACNRFNSRVRKVAATRLTGTGGSTTKTWTKQCYGVTFSQAIAHSRAKLRTGSNENDKMRLLGDSNPCGQSPADFESASLTTRTRCLRREIGILWYLVYLFVELAEFAKIMLILHVPNANHIQHHGRAHLGTSVWCVCLARTSFQPWWACCRSLIWSLSSTLLSS